MTRGIFGEIWGGGFLPADWPTKGFRSSSPMAFQRRPISLIVSVGDKCLSFPEYSSSKSWGRHTCTQGDELNKLRIWVADSSLGGSEWDVNQDEDGWVNNAKLIDKLGLCASAR